MEKNGMENHIIFIIIIGTVIGIVCNKNDVAGSVFIYAGKQNRVPGCYKSVPMIEGKENKVTVADGFIELAKLLLIIGGAFDKRFMLTKEAGCGLRLIIVDVGDQVLRRLKVTGVFNALRADHVDNAFMLERSRCGYAVAGALPGPGGIGGENDGKDGLRHWARKEYLIEVFLHHFVVVVFQIIIILIIDVEIIAAVSDGKRFLRAEAKLAPDCVESHAVHILRHRSAEIIDNAAVGRIGPAGKSETVSVISRRRRQISA